jgi:DNA-binding CsgD family transcriptional regulator
MTVERAGAEGGGQAARGGRLAFRVAGREIPIFGVLFVMLAGFVSVDLVADSLSGIGPVHMAVEVVALAAAFAGIGIAARESHAAVRRAEALLGDLKLTRADVARWRAEAEGLLRRYGMALDERFDRWGLTDAEREIAIPILKGLSYKEIASARGTTERTVRHQALAVFRKAGVSGRAEMAAFFLEELLLPAHDASAHDGEPAESPPRPRAEA